MTIFVETTAIALQHLLMLQKWSKMRQVWGLAPQPTVGISKSHHRALISRTSLEGTITSVLMSPIVFPSIPPFWSSKFYETHFKIHRLNVTNLKTRAHGTRANSTQTFFKLCCLMHSIFHWRCPDYLSNIVRPVDLSCSCAGLRSSSTTNFAMPQLRTKCGERAFSHAGPAAWNALPEDTRAVSDTVVFRKRLQTHF